MIYRMRAILDTEEDVIRDLEIEASASLEELHDALSQSFGFAGNEMASFYRSDEHWNQGEEMPLFDMDSGENPFKDKPIEKILSESESRLIYVYDFLNLWTFYLELIEIAQKEASKGYPSLIFTHGEVPETPSIMEFGSSDDLEDDFKIDREDNDNDNFY